MIKRFYTLVLLVLTVGIGQAQTWNVGMHTNSKGIIGKTWTNNKEINLLIDEEYPVNTYWLKYSKSGQLIQKKKISPHLIGFDQLPDGGLLIGEFGKDCDAVLFNYGLAKINSNGVKTASVSVPFSPQGICVMNDSLYWIYDTTNILIVQKDLTTIQHYTPFYSKIAAVKKLNNDMVLFSARSNNTDFIFRYLTNGVKIDSIAVPTLFYQLDTISSGNILASGTNGVVYKYSKSLLPLGNSSNLTYKFYTHQTLRNDTILGITGNSQQTLLFMDTSFLMLKKAELTTTNQKLRSVGLNENQVVSISSLNQGNFNTLAIQTSLFNDSIGFKADAALEVLYFTNARLVPLNNKYFIKLNAIVNVKNTGSIPFNKVNITNNSGFFNLCDFMITNNQYPFLLPPGSQTTIVVNDYIFEYKKTSSSSGIDICLYVTIPEGQGDKVSENNLGCKKIYQEMLSLTENEREKSIYPNPFQKIILFENTFPIQTIRVHNLSGQLLYEFNPGASSYQINTENWEKGIYLIEIVTQEGTQHDKVIKNE